MEHLPEWLTGIATFLLTVATGFLVWATWLLAKVAAEEGRSRKIEATTTSWLRLRPNLILPNLSEEKDAAKIETAGKRVLPFIMEMEAYAACVNSGVYDIETFNRISGAWFVQHFRWIEPYITLHRAGPNPPYDELVQLNITVQRLRSRHPGRELASGLDTVQ